ncbi:MAG: energy transducer TonB [Bacteroidetes bacterium]|nr:energy transducer TonB [Bacteroidota bacterium]
MLQRENKAGIYLTLSVHLGLLVIFLLYQIHFELKQESAFVLDFTKQEELERSMQKEQLKAEVSEELNALFASGRSALRNVAVDASEQRNQSLRDDRHNNPSQVYDEARALQAKLDASRKAAQAFQGSDDDISPQAIEQPQAETYKGPSVLTWKLEGRRATSLPIPVYKCLGGGDVTVVIAVDPKGYVLAASVVAAFSSSDPCLREYALRAAKASRFSRNDNAPPQQQGEIVYRFIAQ